MTEEKQKFFFLVSLAASLTALSGPPPPCSEEECSGTIPGRVAAMTHTDSPFPPAARTSYLIQSLNPI